MLSIISQGDPKPGALCSGLGLLFVVPAPSLLPLPYACGQQARCIYSLAYGGPNWAQPLFALLCLALLSSGIERLLSALGPSLSFSEAHTSVVVVPVAIVGFVNNFLLPFVVDLNGLSNGRQPVRGTRLKHFDAMCNAAYTH